MDGVEQLLRVKCSSYVENQYDSNFHVVSEELQSTYETDYSLLTYMAVILNLCICLRLANILKVAAKHTL